MRDRRDRDFHSWKNGGFEGLDMETEEKAEKDNDGSINDSCMESSSLISWQE